MTTIDDPKLRLYIVWTPNLRSDSRLESVVASNEFDDSRLSYYWDEELITGKAWGRVLGIDGFAWTEGVAWDVYFLYGDKYKWSDAPSNPDYYMHQLGSLPRDQLLNPETLIEETRRLLQQI